MDKQTIISLLHRNYSTFVVYINGLTPEEYTVLPDVPQGIRKSQWKPFLRKAFNHLS